MNSIDIKVRLCKIINKVLSIVERIRFCFSDKNNSIILNVWTNHLCGKIYYHKNFGDDLNVYMVRELTSQKIFNYNLLNVIQNHVLAIGSIINTHCTPRSIIWGSGAMYSNIPLSKKPYKVLAVRGKLTRKYLVEQGVECPEVYGDPALLLPLIYKPKPASHSYKWGIIPHFMEENDEKLEVLKKTLPDSIVISFRHYGGWQEVINKIVSCECIISTSLHGLIISDAYGIPNIWAEFSQMVGGDRFKYLDYFSSVGRQETEPMIINNNTCLDVYDTQKEQYSGIHIDLTDLINSAPFEIRSEIRNRYKA